MSYTREQYTEQLIALFPLGKAFPRDNSTNFYKMIYSFTKQFKDIDDCAEALPEDWFPATTTNFLTEWQKSLGLPDKCLTYQSSFEDQRAQVVSRLTFTGEESIGFLTQFCESLGYTVDIQEWGQIVCNAQSCNSVACGPINRENEHYITIQITSDKDSSFLICELAPLIPPSINFLIFDNKNNLIFEN